MTVDKWDIWRELIIYVAGNVVLSSFNCTVCMSMVDLSVCLFVCYSVQLCICISVYTIFLDPFPPLSLAFGCVSSSHCPFISPHPFLHPSVLLSYSLSIPRPPVLHPSYRAACQTQLIHWQWSRIIFWI